LTLANHCVTLPLYLIYNIISVFVLVMKFDGNGPQIFGEIPELAVYFIMIRKT
jgi:hypothetical protein